MSRTKSLNFDDARALEVLVKPNARESSIIFDEERKIYIVSVKSQAEDGKANSEVLRLIKKLSGRDGKIISGAASRKKLIKFE